MMADHQQPSVPPTLDIGLPANMAWMMPTGLFAIVGGVACLLLGIFWRDLTVPTGGEGSSGLAFIAMGVLFPPMGVVGIWVGYRMSATALRVTKWPGEVVFEWRSASRVVRTERAPLAEVVEVVVSNSPSSGTSLYGLVVGMKNGEISLSNTYSSYLQQHWTKECHRLAAFRGVPARTAD